MKPNDDTPSIRFAGFTDAWEQRKLGEVVDVCSGCDYKSLSEGTIPVYGTGGYMLSVNKALSYTEDAVGIGRKGTIDKPYILRAPFWTVDTLFYAVPRMDYDLQFVLGVFLKIDWKKKDESTGVPSLSKVTINTTEIVVPKVEEQRKIGNLLQSIDLLITLHQRKYDQLVNIKKSMLEKMFPKNGELVPEVRFAGFTDAWEQRKVGDFAKVLSAARVHKHEWTEQGVPFFRSSDVMRVHNGRENEKVYISQELFEELSMVSGRPEKGDIFITGGGSIGMPYIVPNDNPLYSKDADLLWIKNSENHNSQYLYSYFFTPTFRNYIASISHIGTIAHYTIVQVKETPVLLPKIREQEKIGSFFSNLDSLITLHQRKLERLQNIKKACLEKMFV